MCLGENKTGQNRLQIKNGEEKKIGAKISLFTVLHIAK